MDSIGDLLYREQNYQKRRVIAINIKTGEEVLFSSRKEASAILGVSDTSISSIIAGRFYQSNGWTFRNA